MELTSKALHQVPFSRISLAFILGILVRNYIGASHIGSSLLLISLSLLLLIALIVLNKVVKQQHRFQQIFGILTILVLLILGFLFSSYFIEKSSSKIPLTGYYSGIVTDKTMFNPKTAKLSVTIDEVKDSNNYVFEKEQIVMMLGDSVSANNVQPGNRITFMGTLVPVENKGNPGEYNFKRYLEIKGVNKQISLKTPPLIENENNIGLRIAALRLRSKLLAKFSEYGIKGDEFAVLAALTLGDKTDLSSELKQSFSASGAMHVLSVSGLHVGVIFLVLEFFLKALNRNRNTKLLKTLIIVFSLWGYAFITGLSPSVLRASTMLSFVTVGKNIGKNNNVYNTLFSSALLLLLIDPLILFDVGFQLSYFAVFSIVYFHPKIFRLLTPKSKLMIYLWSMLSVSLAAQIGTTPICFYYFHQFPVYFWISNFVVIPLSAFIIYGAILFFVVSPFPIIASIVAYIVSKLTWIMNISVLEIERLPGSVITGVWISLFTMIVLYLMLLNFLQFIKTKKATFLLLMLLSVIILLTESCLKVYRRANQQLLIVYNTYPNEAMSLINGNSHYYIHLNSIDSTIIPQAIQAASYYGTSNPHVIDTNSATPNEIKISNNLVLFGNKSVFIANQVVELDVSKKLNVDYVYIKKELWKNSDFDINNTDYKMLIIKSFSDQFAKKRKMFNLKRQGAFVTNL